MGIDILIHSALNGSKRHESGRRGDIIKDQIKDKATFSSHERTTPLSTGLPSWPDVREAFSSRLHRGTIRHPSFDHIPLLIPTRSWEGDPAIDFEFVFPDIGARPSKVLMTWVFFLVGS